MAFRELLRIRNVRRLGLTQFLLNLSFYSSVIVAFETSRGLDMTEIFALESVLGAAIFLMEVPSGVAADRWGYRRVLLAGLGCYLASHVLFAVAHGFWLFVLSSVLGGAGLACLSGCDSALLYESLPAGRREELAGSAFSLMGAFGSGGFFVGLATGSFLGAVDPAVAVVASVPPIALALVTAWGVRSGARSEMQGTQETGAASAADAAPLPAAALLRQAVDLVRSQPRSVGLSLLSSAAFALCNAIFWYNQPLFGRAGLPVAWFGPLTAAAVGLQMVVTARASTAEQRLGLRGALVLAALVPGLAYLGAVFATGPALSALLVAGVVAGSGWRQPLVQAELNRRIPDGARATTLSALSFLGTLATITLNPLIGWLGDQGLPVAMGGMGAGLVLVAGLFWWNRR